MGRNRGEVAALALWTGGNRRKASHIGVVDIWLKQNQENLRFKLPWKELDTGDRMVLKLTVCLKLSYE